MVPSVGDPQALNRYAYTNNNPVKYTDPSGHMITCGEGPDIRGGCGENSEWYSGKAQDIATGKHQFYANCAQGGGSECNSLHDVENIIKGAGLIFAGLLTGGGADAAGVTAGAADAVATAGARATVACVNSTICAGLAGLGGAAGAEAASGAEIPSYSAEEWAARQQVVEREGGIFKCAFCAEAMSDQTGDAVVTLTTDEGALLGPGGSNIGAPAGWHMMTIDQLGNAWDNFGFQGNAGDFLREILAANPSGVNVSVFRIYDDAWAWLTGGH